MGNTVIKVDNLSKRYIIGHQKQDRYQTLRDTLAIGAKRFGKRLLHPFQASSGQPLLGDDESEEFWALKNVSFEVKQGDRIGIIGRNGAGKSTLLKILSRITEPTKGKAQIKGRVSSLLEVGTGFHPELTGRENIFLNGAILGMSRQDIRKKFDEIVAFAEVEKFLDTPVKRYSSGMYVRLAFAVAAHLEPEILLIDEVLAVGDSQFQKKCLNKMEEVSQEGRTILFVSHNMAAVQALCTIVVTLHNGLVSSIGEVEPTIKKYLLGVNKGDNNCGQVFYSDKSFSAMEFKLYSMKALDQNNKIRSDFVNSEPIFIELEFSLQVKIPYLKIGIEVRDALGAIIFISFHNDIKEVLTYISNASYRYHLRVSIPKCLLNEGLYYINPLIGIHRKKWLIKDIRGLSINVSFNLPNTDYLVSKRIGSLAPLLDWQQTS